MNQMSGVILSISAKEDVLSKNAIQFVGKYNYSINNLVWKDTQKAELYLTEKSYSSAGPISPQSYSSGLIRVLNYLNSLGKIRVISKTTLLFY